MAATGTDSCRVLEFDPDIGAGIDPQEWELARSVCLARLCEVPAGPWDAGALAAEEPYLLGFIVVSGVVCREVSIGERRMLELLGPGEFVQPPAGEVRPRLGGPVMLTAVTDSTVLALGEVFIRAAARWPRLLLSVHERLEAQRENLAIQGLIVHLPRAEHRVLLQLWHLADRWGRVTVEGTLLPLSLTHELLGQLAAARRSTVTLAVAALEADGLIRRVEDAGWLLTPAVDDVIASIAGDGIDGPPLGESFRVRHRAAAASEEPRAQSRPLLHRGPDAVPER